MLVEHALGWNNVLVPVSNATLPECMAWLLLKCTSLCNHGPGLSSRAGKLAQESGGRWEWGRMGVKRWAEVGPAMGGMGRGKGWVWKWQHLPNSNLSEPDPPSRVNTMCTRCHWCSLSWPILAVGVYPRKRNNVSLPWEVSCRNCPTGYSRCCVSTSASPFRE